MRHFSETRLPCLERSRIAYTAQTNQEVQNHFSNNFVLTPPKTPPHTIGFATLYIMLTTFGV